MIVDTSVLIALFDRSDSAHREVSEAFSTTADEMIVSPYVVAEVDYLVSTRHGIAAEVAVLQELSSEAWTLAQIDTEDLERAISVLGRYSDQAIGVTDASIVVLAARYGTRTIATLDRRHFDALRPLTRGRFRVVP